MEQYPGQPNERNPISRLGTFFIDCLKRTREYATKQSESKRLEQEAVVAVFENNPNQFIKLIDVTRTTGIGPGTVWGTVDRLVRGGQLEKRARYMGATLIQREGFDPVFEVGGSDTMPGNDPHSLPTPQSIQEMRAVTPAWHVDYRYPQPEEDPVTQNQPTPHLHA